MQKIKYLTTIDEVKALSDPYRYKILSYFFKINAPATVKQIADSMEEVPAKVHYHVKKLEKAGILNLVRTEEINGIIAKYYEPTAEDFEVKLAEDYSKLEENNSKLMLAELQKMISKFYDTGKNQIIDYLNEYSKVHKKGKASLSMEDLYITEEEAIEFSKYIINFINQHKSPKKDNGDVKQYHTFFSMVKVLDENDYEK